MKKIFASVSRLTVAYSKFGIMIFSLSLMNTALKADQSFYYLAANSQFLKLGAVYVQNTQNIRNNKMINELIKNKDSLNGEYYASLVYNNMCKDGLKTLVYDKINHFCQWGTPFDLEEYNYWSEIFKVTKT